MLLTVGLCALLFVFESCINHAVETHTEIKTLPSPAGVMVSRETY